MVVTCGNCGRLGTAHRLGSLVALPALWGRGSVDGSLPMDLCEDCYWNPGADYRAAKDYYQKGETAK